MKSISLVLTLLLSAPILGAEVPAGSANVVVFPFAQTASDGRYRFIAQSFQRNIVAEISRTGIRRAIASASTPSDARQALSSARDQHAGFVVTGTFEVSTNQLRITGQVLSVDAAMPIGDLQASGSVQELFKLEDQISQQVQTALNKPAPATAPAEVLASTQPATRPAEIARASAPLPEARDPNSSMQIATASDLMRTSDPRSSQSNPFPQIIDRCVPGRGYFGNMPVTSGPYSYTAGPMNRTAGPMINVAGPINRPITPVVPRR